MAPFSQEQIDALNEFPRFIQPLGRVFNYTPGDGGGDGLGDLLAAGGSGVTSLAALTDVSLAGLANNNFLVYNSGTSKWENETVASVVSILGSVMALDDLSDVVITAAANNDFLKYNGTNWVDFPLFSTSNSWTATQNVQHVLPITDDIYDLGMPGQTFRTIYLHNSGGYSIIYPSAVSTNAVSDYSLFVGGGAAAGADAAGGRFNIIFDDIDFGNTGNAYNELLINLGSTTSTAGFISRLTIQASVPTVPVTTGQFTITPGVPPAPVVDFSFDSDNPALAGGTEIRFSNQQGNISFQPTVVSFNASGFANGIQINPEGTDGATGCNLIYRVPDSDVVLCSVNLVQGAYADIATSVGDKHAWSFGRRLSNSGTVQNFNLGYFAIRPDTRRTINTRPYHHFFVAPSTTDNGSGGSPVSIQLNQNKSTGTASITANNIITTASFAEPNIDLNSFTLGHAVTVYIQDAPTEATLNYALWVDSGTTRLDGTLTLGTTTGVDISAAAGVLTLAGVGNTNNENLTFNFESVANTVTVASGTSVSTLALGISTVSMTNAVVSTNLDFNASGDGVRLSGTTAGVLTMASVGNTNNENLTFDLETTPNVVTVASGTSVADLVLSSLALNLNSTGVRLSGSSGVLTMRGSGGVSQEDLTFDLNTSNIVTVASTTSVSDLVLSFANVRVTTALEIDGNLNHDGTNIAFFNQTGGSQQTGLATLTDSTTGGATNNDVAAIGDTTTVNQGPTINDNFREVLEKINQIRGILNTYGLTTVV